MRLKQITTTSWQTWDQLITIYERKDSEGPYFYFRVTSLINDHVIISINTWRTLHDLKEFISRVDTYKMKELYTDRKVTICYAEGEVFEVM